MQMLYPLHIVSLPQLHSYNNKRKKNAIYDFSTFPQISMNEYKKDLFS